MLKAFFFLKREAFNITLPIFCFGLHEEFSLNHKCKFEKEDFIGAGAHGKCYRAAFRKVDTGEERGCLCKKGTAKVYGNISYTKRNSVKVRVINPCTLVPTDFQLYRKMKLKFYFRFSLQYKNEIRLPFSFFIFPRCQGNGIRIHFMLSVQFLFL